MKVRIGDLCAFKSWNTDGSLARINWGIVVEKMPPDDVNDKKTVGWMVLWLHSGQKTGWEESWVRDFKKIVKRLRDDQTR